MTQVNDKIMAESKKHKLGDEECTVAHSSFEKNHDGEYVLWDRGQCRWCSRCIQWVRPKDFDGDCNTCSHREDKPECLTMFGGCKCDRCKKIAASYEGG